MASDMAATPLRKNCRLDMESQDPQVVAATRRRACGNCTRADLGAGSSSGAVPAARRRPIRGAAHDRGGHAAPARVGQRSKAEVSLQARGAPADGVIHDEHDDRSDD